MVVAPPNIIGRAEARALGLTRYFTGKPCKHGHVAERGVRRRECTECRRGRLREWRAANLEKERARGRKYAATPKRAERVKEIARKWRAANPEKARAYRRMRLAANKDESNKRRAAAQQRAARASESNGAGRPGDLEGNFST
jgi:hypothetical protein